MCETVEGEREPTLLIPPKGESIADLLKELKLPTQEGVKVT